MSCLWLVPVISARTVKSAEAKPSISININQNPSIPVMLLLLVNQWVKFVLWQAKYTGISKQPFGLIINF